jgi:AraC family transcriptional regulator
MKRNAGPPTREHNRNLETCVARQDDKQGTINISPASLVTSIADQTGRSPQYALRTARGETIAARWRHPPSGGTLPDTNVLTVALHLSGSTAIERWKPSLRKLDRGSRVGTVTLMSPHEVSKWDIREEVDVLHIYVPPSAIAEHAVDLAPDAFRDVFSERNAWLCQFGELMLQYAETHLNTDQPGDALLLEQMRDTMARYVTLQYRDTKSGNVKTESTELRRARLSPTATRKVTQWLAEHYAENISVKDMAAMTCLSETHFLRAFRDTVGQTPYRYLQKIRLNAAREMLRHSSAPISTVASACGYGSASHFCVEFAREVGMPPGRFRRQCAD